MNDVARPLSLEWQGPFSFSDLLRCEETRENFNVLGVYLWTEVRGGTDVLSYVGRATGSPTLW